MNKKVALIYPYFLTDSSIHILFQPLGIASLASQIKVYDIEVRQFDCTFEEFNNIIDKIILFNPSIIGIYIMTTLSRNAIKILKALKDKLPNELFICGGPLPTLYPNHFSGYFDAVFQGEADCYFPLFCFDFINNDLNTKNFFEFMDLSKYKGIYTEKNGKIMKTESINNDEMTINNLPLPDRRGTDYKKYQEFWSKNYGYQPATIMLTYGCPFNCDFCSKPVFGNLFRKRNLDKVIEEIKDIKILGFDNLWIADDSLTLDNKYLEAFCQKLIQENINIQWSCLSRIKGITESLINLMNKAGCFKIYLGLESGDNKTLKLMKKETTVEQGIRAVSIIKKAGIETVGFFIVGYPGETLDSIEKTFNLALSLELEEIYFTVPYPLPGSELFKRVVGVQTHNDWDLENEVKFLFDTEFDIKYLKRRIDETMDQFTMNKNTKLVVQG